MISDVPIGVMLSGGIDSSLIAAIAQKKSLKKINTYCIGFNNKGFDESKYAKKISNILSTSHNEFILDDYSIEDLVEKIPFYYDEPFADSSQIPSMIISKELKKKVTVCLTGDGGDEVFGGYTRYIWGNKFSKICNIFPIFFRNIISRILNTFPSEKINKFNELFPNHILPSQLGDRMKKIGKIILSKSNYEIYLKLITQMEDKVLLNQSDFHKNSSNYIFSKKNIIEAMQIMDLKNYLPGDILTKIDRASMASSLELRSPLLDYRLIEFSFNNLILKDKIYGNKGKYILRQILKNYIPENLINRPKMGFAIPLSKWLRGRLKNWMLDTLNLNKIKSQNILNSQQVGKMINDHIKSKRNCHHELWNILMFQTWFDKWMK
jgi:asparagine synthase (glutamine-hydrolysing)